MNEQILITYTPNEEGFIFSVKMGDKSLFDYKDNTHEPKHTNVQFIEELQNLINENIN